jgi:hypothetical protein
MSFLDVIRALGRQWAVTLAGLLMTGALIWGVTVVAPPVYTARALVLLVPSEQAVGEGGNPFLALGGLDLPARVVVAYYESDVAGTRFASASPEGEFVVTIEESTRGPVIAVDVTDATPQDTLATLDRITESIPVELRRLQEEVDAPPESVVSTLLLAKDERAQTDAGGTVRLLIAVGGGGLVATGVLAVAIDGLVRARRTRSAAASAAASAPAAPAAAPASPATPATPLTQAAALLQTGKGAGSSAPPTSPMGIPRPLPRLVKETPPSVPPAWRNPRPDDAQARSGTEKR